MTSLFLSRRARSRQGFTLMELLIVLSIIALLVGMAIYKLGDVTIGARVERVQTDLLTFKEGLAAYQLESGNLPTTEQGLKALWIKPVIEPIPDHWRATFDQETLDPWNHPYQYQNPGKHNPERYDVWSMGPDGISGNDDDIGNWQEAKSGHS